MDLFLGETTLVEALAVLENPDGADSRAFGSGESMTAIDDLTYIPGYTHTNYTFTIHEPSGIRTEKRFSSTSSDRFKLRFINGILSQVVDN
jgi:hypothetical protein